jgi:NAD(P)-dependent dehydrogenase (short-subunit alcohol dehydrogenase family)
VCRPTERTPSRAKEHSARIGEPTAPSHHATKTALVTGASSGIGEATALKLHELGYTVYGAARRTERLQQLASRGVRPLAMDVTDDDSMRAGVEQIVAETGCVDVLVNNAGYGSYGAIEDVPLDEARRQFAVNVFGAMRLTQLVLPHMREQRSGTVVNISSMGGKIHTPLGGWYHGTKFAVEALSDCLRLEVKPFGSTSSSSSPAASRPSGARSPPKASSWPPARAPTPTRPRRWPNRSARRPTS